MNAYTGIEYKRALTVLLFGSFALGFAVETTPAQAEHYPCSLIWVRPFKHSHNEVQICAPVYRDPVRPAR
jgi:hypothetical protein